MRIEFEKQIHGGWDCKIKKQPKKWSQTKWIEILRTRTKFER
jgi:hypothetical protein